MKTLTVNIDDIYSEMPRWVPLSEWALRSYIIKNPQLIANEARFIGCEIYRVDLIFETNDEIFFVETKSDGSSGNIEKATRQLDEARERLRHLNFNKKLEMVMAYISDKPPQKINLKPLDERLNDEISVLQREKHSLSKEITNLQNQIEELRMRRVQVRKWVERKERSGKGIIKIKPKCSACLHFSFDWCNKLKAPTTSTSSCRQDFFPRIATTTSKEEA